MKNTLESYLQPSFNARVSAAAVIASFQPGNSILGLANALSLSNIPVMVTDDASPVTSDPVLRSCQDLAGVTVIRHSRNQGIARGLNDGLRFAQESGASWLLTFDQDSEVTDNYVSAIVEYAESLNSLWSDSVRIGAVGAAHIQNSSGELEYPITLVDTSSGSIACTEEVIQSGTLWNVEALVSFGGFDETLGMDAVDAAACLRLREKGYRIALAPELTLIHNLGDSRPVKLFGRTVLATGHSPSRRATIMRNRLRLAPAEFKQSPKHAIRTLRRIGVNAALGVSVENDRWEKAKGSFRGLFQRHR